MCGLAGFWTNERLEQGDRLGHMRRMATTLARRGPDDSGEWAHPTVGVTLGFRRLAILDLSPSGHQPMMSHNGQFHLVYNGEIYNHRALRAELRTLGHAFIGHSDTEVVCCAFEQWGVRQALSRFDGMFAIAAWDDADSALWLARDRMGIKPLFVHHQPGFVSFGSELKALVAGPLFDFSLDPAAVDAFLRHLYVPAPASIYARTRKLLPGHVMCLRSPDDAARPSEAYWSLAEVAHERIAAGRNMGDAEAIDALEAALSAAVETHLDADVPLGAFLSGGIDSSVVVVLAQKARGGTRTFSVGFDERTHDESEFAAAVARHLNTVHTEIRISSNEALALVGELPDMYDEPFADPSQLPTRLVCQAAREYVTVALSGDGGDELFAGYNRYRFGERLFPRVQAMPRWLRSGVAKAITAPSTLAWDHGYAAVERYVPLSMRGRLVGEKVHKLGKILGQRSTADMYRALVTVWPEEAQLLSAGLPAAAVSGCDASGTMRVNDLTLADAMLLEDQLGSLVDDQLAKVDRASMSVSLEVRVPLLDHHVVEQSWTLPPHLKLRQGVSKYALRQVLYRHVPRELIDRPKVGFSVPIGEWLRGPLRPWAAELLHSPIPAIDGLLDAGQVTRVVERLHRGDDSVALAVWAVLMLRAWARRWLD